MYEKNKNIILDFKNRKYNLSMTIRENDEIKLNLFIDDNLS